MEIVLGTISLVAAIGGIVAVGAALYRRRALEKVSSSVLKKINHTEFLSAETIKTTSRLADAVKTENYKQLSDQARANLQEQTQVVLSGIDEMNREFTTMKDLPEEGGETIKTWSGYERIYYFLQTQSEYIKNSVTKWMRYERHYPLLLSKIRVL
jgi:hypothetical protein